MIKWIIASLAGVAFMTNLPALIQSLEWIALLLCVTAIVVADRWVLGKADGSNYSFSVRDPNMWVTTFCLLIIAGLTGVYIINTLIQG